jgi:hypothetical protein
MTTSLKDFAASKDLYPDFSVKEDLFDKLPQEEPEPISGDVESSRGMSLKKVMNTGRVQEIELHGSNP